MREVKIGKTTVEVRRQNGHDELQTNVIYRKLITVLQEDDPFILSTLHDAAWVFSQVCGSIQMKGTLAGWCAPRYTDTPERLLEAFNQWQTLNGALRDLLRDAVRKENAPINDPALVPEDYLSPEERNDPKESPPEGGKSQKSIRISASSS